MKSRITTRLFLNFALVILLFTLITGGLYLPLFTNHTTAVFRDNLKSQATEIADSVADYLEDSSSNSASDIPPSEQDAFDGYLHIISQVVTGHVWIIDRESRRITAEGDNVSYHQLQEAELALLDSVFEGNVVTGEDFSVFLNSPSITAGAPVKNADGTVIAAVLLHSHIDQLATANRSSITILLGCFAGSMLLAVALSFLLSHRFVQPLNKMATTTNRLTNGDYSAQTGVLQNDEIGALAAHIDVLANRLQLASKESAALEQMRRDYISNISHELRTPVMVLRGSLEALRDGVVSSPDKVNAYHQEMLNECIHLQRMVNDLLELSRLQNVKYSIEKSPIDLADVLQDSIRAVRRVADAKKQAIVTQIEPVSCPIAGDYGRLRQMFLTVLDNSVKFSTTDAPVAVFAGMRDERYVVTVANRGRGISKEALPRIFESFYKGEPELNESGTGLGLSIAKQIADRHHIRIEVESEQSGETVFRFSLDLPPQAQCD